MVKEIPTCYWCNQPDHIKPDCPLGKKDKGKDGEAIILKPDA